MTRDRFVVACSSVRQFLRVSCILAVAVTISTSASGARETPIVKAAVGPLYTSIFFHDLSSSANRPIELERIRAAGARIASIYVFWSVVAPKGPKAPTGFQPRNPADPNYDWHDYDNAIRAISDAGLEPRVLICGAPVWAEGADPPSGTWPGTYKPSPAALANFAAAAARRYSGSFEDLPRVRYWSIWNEPNLSAYLSPQTVNGKAFAPSWYRAMLNGSADAIHSVNADNIVIAGETAPFWEAELPKTSPIAFMEKVLCISEKKVKETWTYKSACKQRAKFDVWAHHPFTEGGPTHRAQVHGNASLGDLGDMRVALNAAIRTNHVVSKKRVRFWVTEFSWESNPPDPGGVPVQLEARWVSQALYQAWKAGVSLFTWTRIRDDPVSMTITQGGLYYRNNSGIASDRAKPALRAFRFPFVALRQPKNKVLLWGRTPTSTSGNVLIERESGAKWKRVKRLKANRYGVFQARIDEPAKATYLRARLATGRDWSVQFSLQTPKKTWAGCVWGSPCSHAVS